MSWKNYFYIQRQDRLAIILLALLIVMCAGLYITLETIDQHKEKLTVEHEFEKKKLLLDLDSTNRLKYNIDYPKKLELGKKIELNLADTSQLMQIPGIGSVYANRIVGYRTKLGQFKSLEQLKEIKGLKGKTLLKIIPYLSVDSCKSD